MLLPVCSQRIPCDVCATTDGGSTFLHGQGGKQSRYLGALNQLCSAGIIEACPPLVVNSGAYVAQYEHTLILRPTCKEVLSRGDDF